MEEVARGGGAHTAAGERSPPRLFRRIPLPAVWLLLSLLVVWIDRLLGPYVQFPVAFVAPVGLAAWFSGWRWGLPLAMLLPLARLYHVSIWDPPWDFHYSVLNAAIRVLVLGGLALLLDRTARQGRELKTRMTRLEGLLPICSGCKRIRDDEQRWQPLEQYIGQRSAATFTHGICPGCAERYFGEYATGD